MMAGFISRRESQIVALLFFLAPFITLSFPLTTVPVLIVLSVGCMAIAVLHGQNLRELFRFDVGFALFAVAAGYLLINASWSLAPSRALSKVAWFALVTILTFGAARALSAWNERQIKAAVRGFIVGVAAGVAFIVIQLATDQTLERLLLNASLIARPERLKGIKVEGGEVTSLSLFYLNRNMAVMLLALWPMLLCLTRLSDTRLRRLSIAGLGLTIAAAIAFSAHQTSQVGLAVSVLTFVATWVWPTATRRGVLLAWCAAFALVVPLSSLAFKSGLYDSEWLPYSAKARIVLWGYTVENIPTSPALGIGISSTRMLGKPAAQSPTDPTSGKKLPWNAGWHSHNIFLEAWFELGAVGVILFLAAGCAVIAYIGRLSATVQPLVLAQFAAYCVVAAFGWGMWQSWLMALPGLAGIYATLAVNAERVTLTLGERIQAELPQALPR